MFRSIFIGFTASALLALSSPVNAEGLLALVTEETADETAVEQTYWWRTDATPQWSKTDLALRSALKASGLGFAEPADTTALSKIYRRPAPSDANAAAMASVFGRSKALVGTVRYEPTELRPIGLVGWKATVTLRLVEQSSRGVSIVRAVEFQRFNWAISDDEAREKLRADLAGSVAAAVSAGLERKSGPVGLARDELLIGVAGPTTRPALEAVRTKLQSFAGVTSVQEIWAAEGIVVFELNPAAVDARPAVGQYASLLTTEGAAGWAVVPVESSWPNVVVVQLEER